MTDHPLSPRPRQDLAIAQAISDLTWCNTAPHGIDHLIRLCAQTDRLSRTRWAHGTSTDAMADSLRAGQPGTGSGGDSTWSDPTATAALTATTDGSTRDDPSVPAIDSALDLLYWSTDELAMLVLDGPRIGPARDRTGRLAATISVLHRCQPAVLPARDRCDRLGRDHIDLLVYQSIAETAEWLHHKGQAIYLGAAERDRDQPVQRAITACTLCSQWRTGTIAVSRGRCAQCATFQDHHKCKPTEAIVRRWEATGNAATPPGMILEAKAAAGKGRRKIG